MSEAQCTPGSDCESCDLVPLSLMIGVMAFDVILTILTALAMLYYGSMLRRRREEEPQSGNGSSKKAEETESPYQELQGVQSDVYSELQHFRR